MCTNHATMRPLEIMLADYVKWNNYLRISRVEDPGPCQYRGGCVHEAGNEFRLGKPGPGEFIVANCAPLCRFHAARLVWGYVLTDPAISYQISIKPYREDDAAAE